jgi:uncharacterized protein
MGNTKIKSQIPDEENIPKLSKSQRIRKIIFLSVGLLAFNIFVWGALYYSFVLNNTQKIETKTAVENKFSDLRKIETKTSEVAPTSKPIPFEELTIPYLQDRDYESKLSELEQVSQNESYSAYLTSYDSDGLRVNGLLTIPTGSRPKEGWPVIVFVHGYIPPQNYQTLNNYSVYVDYLARRGFVVFKIDLRGHGSSEGEPGGAYYSSDYVIDTLNARAALQKTNYVNTEKIGLWGHSMAGNVVSRALAAEPDIPVIVIWAGAVYTYEDFSQFRIQDSSYQPPQRDSERIKEREELFQTHGTFNKDSDFWKKVPMTNYLDDIRGAISIHHAVDDAVVSIEYSWNFKKILEKTDIVHELNEYPYGGHNISGDAFNQAMQNSVDFFNEHLKE